MTITRLKTLVPLILLAAILSGCANLDYYLSSVRGQMNIWQRTESIEALLDHRHTQPPLKLKLATVLQVREFASRELHLPDNRSYRNYADLKRPYVIWNIFAAPEFSVEPKEWCFAFAGCVNYRGYFTKTGAEQFAAGLRKQNYDVYVGGVSAYSTLGWFDDPVLNTFINYPDTELARLIFHELAHQVAYVQDDSMFNESFAVTVEQEGMRRWLARAGTSAQRAAFEAAQQRKNGFIALVMKSRNDLETLFSAPLSVAQKRAGKARIFRQMREDYQQLKITWGGFSRYDQWFEQDLSNAHLASVAVYTQLVPAFQRLLAENNGDLRRFYRAVKKLGSLPDEVRLARLDELNGEPANANTSYVNLKGEPRAAATEF